VAATLGGQIRAGGELVKLSERYAEDVRYATVPLGGDLHEPRSDDAVKRASRSRAAP
jgi:hypothetical protein